MPLSARTIFVNYLLIFMFWCDIICYMFDVLSFLLCFLGLKKHFSNFILHRICLGLQSEHCLKEGDALLFSFLAKGGDIYANFKKTKEKATINA